MADITFICGAHRFERHSVEVILPPVPRSACPVLRIDFCQKINPKTGDRIERKQTSTLRNAWAAGATRPRRKMAKQKIPPDLAWRLLAQIVAVSMLKTIVGIIGYDRSVAR
jgi:hypothetical protein